MRMLNGVVRKINRQPLGDCWEENEGSVKSCTDRDASPVFAVRVKIGTLDESREPGRRRRISRCRTKNRFSRAEKRSDGGGTGRAGRHTFFQKRRKLTDFSTVPHDTSGVTAKFAPEKPDGNSPGVFEPPWAKV